ncbi:C-C motif chemokine 28 [Discoglossus pictus]
MDLRIVSLIATTIILFILQLSEAFSSSNVSCCTELGNHMPKRLLQRVKKYEIQKNNGICDLQAIVLYTKRKIFCMNPQNPTLQKWIEMKKKKNKNIPCSNKKKRKTKKNKGRTKKRNLKKKGKLSE